MAPSKLAVLAALFAAAGAADAVNNITRGTWAAFRGSTQVASSLPTEQACADVIIARTDTTQATYTCRESITAVAVPAPPPPPPPPPPPAPPVVNLNASPGTVTPGAASTLAWSSTNATDCAAGGSWSGTKATSGSESTGPLTASSTFSLTCNGPAGNASAQAMVTVAAAGSQTGLEFAGITGSWDDIRFRFTGANLLPMHPATYVWKLYPKQQAGYYVTFFHASQSFPTSNNFYGAHPYPVNGGAQHWEIAANFGDFVTDANGNDTTVQFNRWYQQALVATVSGSSSVLTFYWDLPNTARKIVATVAKISPVADQALSFGDAPWNVPSERLKGILRGIQIYSGSLSETDILAEAGSPLSTSAGTAAVWYLNLNPTPDDISDKSGRGHNPAWVTTGRPALWQQ